MLTGAAPEVAHRFRTPLGRLALTGVALGLAVAACHRSPSARPAAPPPAKTAATSAESPATAAPPPPRGKQIVVAYSSNNLGEYEPCG